jgi:DnaJ-class molecular chaperone
MRQESENKLTMVDLFLSVNVIEHYRQKNRYEMLGVGSSASASEIKAAYRRLMMLYHPDKCDEFMNDVNCEISRLVNKAYVEIMNERHGE